MKDHTSRDVSLEITSSNSAENHTRKGTEHDWEDQVSTIAVEKNQDSSIFSVQAASEAMETMPGESYREENPTQKGTVAQLHPPLVSTVPDGKPFADLVRTLESYIGDNAADQFQPLLNTICGTGHHLARLGGSELLHPSRYDIDLQAELSEPVPLRHIHSTPLVHIPSILDDDEDEPPPIGLEILSRSRSTPLSTSANSAFGTITRLHLPYMGGPDNRSAFTLPPYRLKPILSEELVSPHHTIFNPIKCDGELESTEQTAIEVVDLPPAKTEDVHEDFVASKAASRAARFLSDVRSLHRRRKSRDGRENPARPPSASRESGKKSENLGDKEPFSSELFTKSCDGKDRKQTAEGHGGNSGVQRNGGEKNALENTLRRTTIYHTLDGKSPGRIEIPTNNKAEDEKPTTQTGRVQIQVSSTEAPGVTSSNMLSYVATSPETCQLTHDPSTLTPQPHDSPETSRSSGTTLTSGHTTQGTATTCSSGHISTLSVISETDLEVMQVNKGGKLPSQVDQRGRVAPAPLSRQPRYPGYIEVADSPTSLRDGASVPAERFFTLAESPNDKRSFGSRLRFAGSMRRSTSVNSPNTLSSSSMTTNSSTSSQDEPPTFVSYLDRNLASDLTSLRETEERASPRQDQRNRERESSPAEIFGYSDVAFEEAQAPPGHAGSQAKPRPLWPTKGFQFGRKVRSLPPRSPKGARTPTTPPPRGGGASPAYDAVSPPRNIVDHQIHPNVSRPYVLRSTPPSSRLLAAHKVSTEVLSSSGNVTYAHIPDVDTDQSAYEVVRMDTDYMSNHYYVTQSRGSSSPKAYNEQDIEVLKVNSKEESSATFVTPAKK